MSLLQYTGTCPCLHAACEVYLLSSTYIQINTHACIHRYEEGEYLESNTSKQEIMSFQNRLYGFIQLVQRLDRRMMAMDISFDTAGCAFMMSWAFESVCHALLY